LRPHLVPNIRSQASPSPGMIISSLVQLLIDSRVTIGNIGMGSFCAPHLRGRQQTQERGYWSCARLLQAWSIRRHRRNCRCSIASTAMNQTVIPAPTGHLKVVFDGLQGFLVAVKGRQNRPALKTDAALAPHPSTRCSRAQDPKSAPVSCHPASRVHRLALDSVRSAWSSSAGRASPLYAKSWLISRSKLDGNARGGRRFIPHGLSSLCCNQWND